MKNDTDKLLKQVAVGCSESRDRLLGRFRDRLRNMVAVRMDPRLTARFDPSDVVQETLITAAKRLDSYVNDRPISVYPWLRQIAQQRLIDLHRRHATTDARSVLRENVDFSSSGSLNRLCEKLVSPQSEPCDLAIRKERIGGVRDALASLSEQDQDLLMMRHLERMKTSEIAKVFGISEAATKSRVRRALERLHRQLRSNASLEDLQ